MKRFLNVLAVAALIASPVMADTQAKWADGFQFFFDGVSKDTIQPMCPVVEYWEFMGADDLTDLTQAGVNSGALTAQAGLGGWGRITTGGADDDDVDVATALNFKASEGCGIEVRLANNDIDKVAFNIGFSDATGEAADLIAVMYATATYTTTATDAAVFVWDPDATTDYLHAICVKANTDQTAIDTTTAIVDAAFHTYRLEINPDGDCSFFYDGAHIGTTATGITTTTALCAYIGVINHGEAAANTVDIDYIRVWQNSR